MTTKKKPTTFFPTTVKTSRTSSSAVAKPRELESVESEQAIQVLTPQVISFQDLPIARIRPNPFQARTDFETEESAEDIEELAQSIREHGFVSVLFVRPDSEEGYFQLAYGERRWRAARLVGLDAVPCRIASYSDEQMEDIGLIENIQRKALNPVDEAYALQRKLSRTNPKTGKPFSIRTLAEHLGVKKHRIEEPLRLCEIPPDCVQLVRKRPDTVRVAFEIAKLPTVELRQPLIEWVLAHEVNTKEVIYLVNQLLDEQNEAVSQQEASLAPPEPVSSGEEQKGDPQGEHDLSQGEAIPLADQPQKVSDPSQEQITEGVTRPANDGDRSEIREQRQQLPGRDKQASPHQKSSVVPTLSLEQRLWEKRVQEDAKVVLSTIGRWASWVEEGTVETSRLREYVQQWMMALQDLEQRLPSSEEEPE